MAPGETALLIGRELCRGVSNQTCLNANKNIQGLIYEKSTTKVKAMVKLRAEFAAQENRGENKNDGRSTREPTDRGVGKENSVQHRTKNSIPKYETELLKPGQIGGRDGIFLILQAKNEEVIKLANKASSTSKTGIFPKIDLLDRAG